MSQRPPDPDATSLLDPADWEQYRRDAHAALDVALDFVRDRQQGPVWQALPDSVRETAAALPLEPQSIPALLEELQRDLLPYTLGNTHPRFWGWVHGTGTPGNIVAQMLTAAINANMGGREHAPIYLERQVIHWLLELFGLPGGASGLICTGTSSATLLALTIARRRAVGDSVRRDGNPAHTRLRAYASAQAHVSIAKALEVLGLGTASLCAVPVTDEYAMDVAALAEQIAQDRRRGDTPFVVVSSVGSVNTGAIDDLQAITALCRKQGLWHHVDGAFGALGVLSDALRPRLAGIADVDSIAFDFHKWMHVSYAAGCLLVADGALHLDTFRTSQSYLRGEHQGMAGGAPWPHDFGLELSRGFAALGVWFQLREMGTRRLGQAIERNCEQARALGREVEADAALELLAPVSLNIVCFRYTAADLDETALNALNRRIVVELQCRGIAAPSYTELAGQVAIRVAITNHRTRWQDLQALLGAVPAIGAELLAEEGVPSIPGA